MNHKTLISLNYFRNRLLALSCHLVGVPFRVYEKTKKNEPLGVKIYIQPYAVCNLIELGLRDELEELSVRTTNVVYFSKLGGENWAEPRGTDTGYKWPQYSIHREKLQTMLHQALKARTHENVLETGCSLTEFQQTIGDINAKFRSRQGTSTFDVTILRVFESPNILLTFCVGWILYWS